MNEHDDYRGAYQSNERANFYEKEIYKKDGFDNFLWDVEKIALLSILKRSFPSLENIQTLDFACGTGRITEFLETHIDKIDALDISDEMVSIAKSKTRNVNYIIGDLVKDTDVLVRKYELITTFRFVLFAQPGLREAVFKKLAQFLNNHHSRLVVGIHGNPLSRRGIIRIFQKLKGLPQENQLRSFSLNDMRALASNAGLEIVDFAGVGFVPRKLFVVFGFKFCNFAERVFYKIGFLKYFGTNLIVVCRLKE